MSESWLGLAWLSWELLYLWLRLFDVHDETVGVLTLCSLLEERTLDHTAFDQPVCYVWSDWVSLFVQRRQHVDHHNRRSEPLLFT